MCPATETLYLSDSYMKEFNAIVTKNKKDYVCLDQTAFYPLGGGQPSDVGFLIWEDNKSGVKEVIKKGDTIQHIIDGEKPSVDTNIRGIINWDKRYQHMKMHTAQHIISGIVFDNYNARTVGNQIYSDYSRVDFYPVSLEEKDLVDIEKKCNQIIKQNLPVKSYNEERDHLEKRVDQERCNLDLLPKFITILRIVEIEGFDTCPCAGTHIKNISELSPIKIMKKENKGKDRERIYYSFESM